MSNVPPPPPPPPPGPPPPPMGMPYGAAVATPGNLAQWPQRALGGLIDFVAPTIIVQILGRASSALNVLLALAALAWGIYNGYLNGSTGQSIGKKVAGLKVVGEQSGQVIGGGLGIVRWLAHFIDSLICLVGWLFPLWDAKRQTIADKIMKTVVITVPK